MFCSLDAKLTKSPFPSNKLKKKFNKSIENFASKPNMKWSALSG